MGLGILGLTIRRHSKLH
ncbi:MAG: hypothetical protein CMG87_10915 [Marinobacter sp.]|nr:hypothetical protein [Marinobacter sp.]